MTNRNFKNSIDSDLSNITMSAELKEKILTSVKNNKGDNVIMYNSKSKKTRILKRILVAAISTFLCFSMSVIALGATIEGVNSLIANYSPGLARFLMPVDLEFENDDLKVNVISAYNTNDVVLVNLSIQELLDSENKNYLSVEELVQDTAVSLILNDGNGNYYNPTGSSGHNYYNDSETNTAYMSFEFSFARKSENTLPASLDGIEATLLVERMSSEDYVHYTRNNPTLLREGEEFEGFTASAAFTLNANFVEKEEAFEIDGQEFNMISLLPNGIVLRLSEEAADGSSSMSSFFDYENVWQIKLFSGEELKLEREIESKSGSLDTNSEGNQILIRSFDSFLGASDAEKASAAPAYEAYDPTQITAVEINGVRISLK